MFDVIAFDADDTLWQNERNYREMEQRFIRLLAPDFDADTVTEALYNTEMRNIDDYGYGLKPFVLSMIETAIRLTGGRISARDIETILGFGHEMIGIEVELLDHVPETLERLAPAHRLMLITKGDLVDQERKVAHSGLRDYFDYIEIVSHKTPARYSTLLQSHQIAPERFLMVGNSLRSDVLPIVEIGGTAVYVPQELTWAHEIVVDPATDHNSYYQLDHIGELPDLLARIAKGRNR